MKGKIFLSLLIGASLGSVTVLVLLFILPELAMPLGLITFGASCMVMHLVLTLSEWRLNKKYLVLEQRITKPVLYKTNGNFAGGPVVNCNLYFCQKSIVIASVESNPYLFDEVTIADILHYEFDRMYLTLYLHNGCMYRFMLADTPEIEAFFHEHYGIW